MSDTLARINTVLAGWEAQPDADADGWLPGDPLYQRPRGGHFDEQTIRPMIALLEDGNAAMAARCVECDVYWRGPAACFVCGQKVPASDSVFDFLAFTHLAPRAARAAASFSEQMRMVAEAFGHEFDRAIAVQFSELRVLREPPANLAAPTVAELEAALPVDGVLYISPFGTVHDRADDHPPADLDHPMVQRSEETE